MIQFNRAVVPIGRMDRKPSEIPVEITPTLSCAWRWLNTSALACHLNDNDQLKQATAYHVKVKPGIFAEDGATTKKVVTHQFTTQRPQVRQAWFNTWRAPTTPVVRLIFNQSVTKKSVEQHIGFTSHKKGADKAFITHDIEVEPDPYDHEAPRFVVVPGENMILDFGESSNGTSNAQKSDDDARVKNGDEARRIWLVSPKKALSSDAKVSVRVKPGIVSAFGTEVGVEERDVVSFHTFPEFTFLGVTCNDIHRKRILIKNERDKARHKCDPLSSVALTFSSPVMPSQVQKHVTITPDLAGGRTDYDPWAVSRDYSRLRNVHKMNRNYQVWLPEKLKAYHLYSIQSKEPDLKAMGKLKSAFGKARAADLEDEFGRTLSKPINMSFHTDNRRPNYHLSHKTAVLEQGIDSEVPLYVTNLDEVTFDYSVLTRDGKKISQQQSIPNVDGVDNIQFSVPMNVRSMLEGKSGAVYGTLSSNPPVRKSYIGERTLFASVSSYQMHVKLGHFNTLVWVTDLATGMPVKGAKVQLYKDTVRKLSADVSSYETKVTDESGIATFKGTSDLDPSLSLLGWCRQYKDDCERFFLRVDKGDAMAVMPLDRRFEINSYRVSNNSVWASSRPRYGHIDTWGTTAQGVYRAGSTIEYKFYVRNQNNETYVLPPLEGYRLEIIDPTGKPVHEIKDITLSEFGSYSGEYTVPENASVGWYRFRLRSAFKKDETWEPIQVLVSDFTPVPFKVTNSLNGDQFGDGDTVVVSSNALLHSGGAYTDAEARITAQLTPKIFASKHPPFSRFRFYHDHQSHQIKLYQNISSSGPKGEMNDEFSVPGYDIKYGQIQVETAVRDERGKYIASMSTADYYGVDRFVGLKATRWLYEAGKKAEMNYVVVDQSGAAVSGTEVLLTIERLETKSAKVKGAGNAYVTQYINEWMADGECRGTSSNEVMKCHFTPEKAGTYRMSASIKDTMGKHHSSQLQFWVTGRGWVMWNEPNDNSLQIIPEKPEYQIGETAKYMIKNPYPGAKALITLERYGILKSWIQTLEGNTPVIEFEVDKDLMPGFYLSATVVSPRVQAPPSKDGQVDLGKPAFKTGYVKVPVNDSYKQIDVTVSTDKEQYKPRDTVTATIHAVPKHQERQEPIEIAVAVLDESVLD
ncbi:MAG: MG2 domain-containing protein [Rickettsiales bacterium]|nr:MG2 domain-containing protein [Rickettsiales bacterium]